MLNPITKTLAVVGALGAFAVGGAALAGAATSTPAAATTTVTVAAPSSSTATPAFSGPAHGTAAHEDAEQAVTGSAAARAQAAAVKLIGSGTAGPVTTDMEGTGYETTVTQADGSTVEVHLDSAFSPFQGGHDSDGVGA